MPTDRLTVATIIEVTKRNFWLVTLTNTAIITAVIVLTLLAGSTYECKATLWIQRSRALLLTNPLDAPEPSQQLTVQILSSRSLRLQIAKELDLMKNEVIWGDAVNEEHTDSDLLDKLDSMIEVYEVRTSPVVQLSVKSSSPELCFKIADKLVQGLHRRMEALQQSESKFLEGQVAARRKRFNTAVQKLTAFQQEHGIVTDPSLQGRVYFESAMELRAGLVKAESELAGVDRMLDAPSDVAGQLELLARKDGLDGAVGFLKDQNDQVDNLMERMPQVGGEYTLLQSEVLVEQELLKQTTITAETARLQAEKENPKLVIVDPPRLPDKPESDIVVRVLLASAFGFVIGLIFAAIRETVRALPKT